jgi:integrase
MSAVRPLVDAAGRPGSAATMPGFHAGRAPRNKGQRYPADPPTVDEIVAVMRQAGQARYGARLNGLVVVLWRAGLRINEALSLTETDLDERRGSILVRRGLCRIRHGPCYAGAVVMPGTVAGGHVLAAVRRVGGLIGSA